MIPSWDHDRNYPQRYPQSTKRFTAIGGGSQKSYLVTPTTFDHVVVARSILFAD